MLASLFIIYFLLFYSIFYVFRFYRNFICPRISWGVLSVCLGSLEPSYRYITANFLGTEIFKFAATAPILHSLFSFGSTSVFAACYVQFCMCHVIPQFDITLCYNSRVDCLDPKF